MNSKIKHSNLVELPELVSPSFEKIFHDDLKCQICSEYLFDPLMCGECELTCCRSCLQDWVKSYDECPDGCKNPRVEEINLTKKKQLLKFLVKCKFGCEVSILSFKTHIIECYEANKEEVCWNCSQTGKFYNLKFRKSPQEEIEGLKETVFNLEMDLKENVSNMNNIEKSDKEKICLIEKKLSSYIDKINFLDNQNADLKEDKELLMNSFQKEKEYMMNYFKKEREAINSNYEKDKENYMNKVEKDKENFMKQLEKEKEGISNKFEQDFMGISKEFEEGKKEFEQKKNEIEQEKYGIVQEHVQEKREISKNLSEETIVLKKIIEELQLKILEQEDFFLLKMQESRKNDLQNIEKLNTKVHILEEGCCESINGKIKDMKIIFDNFKNSPIKDSSPKMAVDMYNLGLKQKQRLDADIIEAYRELLELNLNLERQLENGREEWKKGHGKERNEWQTKLNNQRTYFEAKLKKLREEANSKIERLKSDSESLIDKLKLISNNKIDKLNADWKTKLHIQTKLLENQKNKLYKEKTEIEFYHSDLEIKIDRFKKDCKCEELHKSKIKLSEETEIIKLEVNLLKAQYEELKISKTKLQIRDTNDSITTKADFDNISEYKIIKQSHEKPILCLAVVTNTNFGTVLVSGGEDYCIKVWNTIDMEMIKEITKAHDSYVRCLVVIPNPNNLSKNMLVSGGGLSIKIWDTDEWTILHKINKAHDGWIICLGVVNYGDKYVLVSGSEDSDIKAWNTTDWTIIHTISKAHVNAVSCFAVVPGIDNQTVLVSGSWDKSIKIWNTTNWSLIKQIVKAHDSYVLCITYTKIANNCSILVSGSGNGCIKVWNASDCSLIKKIKNAHEKVVYCINVIQMANESVIISGSSDYTIKIWNTHDFNLIKKIDKAHENSVWCLGVIPTNSLGSMLVSGSSDNSIKIWK